MNRLIGDSFRGGRFLGAGACRLHGKATRWNGFRPGDRLKKRGNSMGKGAIGAVGWEVSKNCRLQIADCRLKNPYQPQTPTRHASEVLPSASGSCKICNRFSGAS